MIKYVIYKNVDDCEVLPCQMERETKDFVFSKHSRHKKDTDWCQYFDSFEEAKKNKLMILNEAIASHQRQIFKIKEMLCQIDKLTNKGVKLNDTNWKY